MALPTIPAGPWTVENLGLEKYDELSHAYGCGIDSSFRPALDLTAPFEAQASGATKNSAEKPTDASANNKGGN